MYLFLISHYIYSCSGLVLVQALPPISTEGKTADDVNALLEETRRVMLPALEKLNAEARKLNGIDDE